MINREDPDLVGKRVCYVRRYDTLRGRSKTQREHGTVTRISIKGNLAFVRYDGDANSKATFLRDLEYLT